MASHLLWLTVFALLVSATFAVLLRDDPRDQLRTGAYVFGAFVVAALLFGWLMYPMPF